MYQLQLGSNTQWLDYEDMIDHLDLVIQYEKDRKTRHQGTAPRRIRPENIEIEGSDEEQGGKGGEEGNEVKKEVKSLFFIEQKDKHLLFRVDFKDGSFRRMTNWQLKEEYPLSLIDFY